MSVDKYVMKQRERATDLFQSLFSKKGFAPRDIRKAIRTVVTAGEELAQARRELEDEDEWHELVSKEGKLSLAEVQLLVQIDHFANGKEVVFETDRLRVFVYRDVAITDVNVPRDVYVAFRNDTDRPMVAATAVLWPQSAGGYWVDWLEVSVEYRREGLGKELLEAIEENLAQPVSVAAGSANGRKFLEALGRPTE